MKQDVKDTWVAALRSGEYTQGVGFLHQVTSRGNERCCLGVLCDLAVKDGVDLHVRGSGLAVEYNGDGYFVPGAVMAWAGLLSNEGALTEEWAVPVGDAADDGPVVSSLASANDDGATFTQIADLIEERWETL